MNKILAKTNFVLTVGIGLLVISLVLNYRYPRRTPDQYAQSLGATTDYFVDQNSNTLTIQNHTYDFNLQTQGSGGQAKLTFFYKCDSNCSRMWLEYPDANQKLVQILIDHPIFHTQKWPHISNNSVSLYQPRARYESIGDFISSPPSQVIATEPYLRDFILLPHLKTQSLMDLDSPSSDYVFTSYIKPRIFAPDWLEFSRVLSIDPFSASISATLNFPDWQSHPTTITYPKLELYTQ